jgi:hypothetical protein
MPVNADAARCRPSLGVNILVTAGGIGPRPASTHHQRLEVVLASKADRDWSVILLVVVHLATRHWTAFLGSVDAEQADALTTELHGIAIRYREAMRGSCAAGI